MLCNTTQRNLKLINQKTNSNSNLALIRKLMISWAVCEQWNSYAEVPRAILIEGSQQAAKQPWNQGIFHHVGVHCYDKYRLVLSWYCCPTLLITKPSHSPYFSLTFLLVLLFPPFLLQLDLSQELVQLWRPLSQVYMSGLGRRKRRRARLKSCL